MLYLGIDQHGKQLTVNIRNEDGSAILKRQVSTEWKRVREFFDRLREEAREDGGFAAIVEVCGFNDWLLKMLAEYDCREIVLVQPDKTSKRKTDRRDAGKLSELLWVNRQRLLAGQKAQGMRRVLPPSAEDVEARQLTSVRKRLAEERTKTINKVHHILQKHNLQQECPTKGKKTKTARRWMAAMTLPSVDRLEMDQLLAQWDLWDDQLEAIEKRIDESQAKHPVARIVRSMPGAGTYSSLALASRIGPIDRFPRPSSLANYWGLAPGCRNSGDVTNRSGSITKEGSAIARHILGQMVLHVLRDDKYVKKWYMRIKKRRGSKIARVAVMRRMATVLWHMVKYDQPYMFGGPPQVKASRAAYEEFRDV